MIIQARALLAGNQVQQELEDGLSHSGTAAASDPSIVAQCGGSHASRVLEPISPVDYLYLRRGQADYIDTCGQTTMDTIVLSLALSSDLRS